jgi:hypothetical protein
MEACHQVKERGRFGKAYESKVENKSTVVK